MSTDPTRFADRTISAFSEALASADPVPGGGSASAVVAGLAASLVAMVARLSEGRDRYAPYTATRERVLASAEAARTAFLDLADADAAAFAAFGAARRLPRESATEIAARDAAIGAAARHAAEIPLEIVRRCHLLVEETESLAGRSNLHAASDLDVAALLCHAAARGAAANVIVNVPFIADRQLGDALIAEVGARLQAIDAAAARVRATVASGTLRSPEDPRFVAG